MTSTKILVPDMGDFKDVEVIEVLVKEGQQIKKNESLITLESDKSSVEVPSTHEGIVEKIKIKVGNKVNQGDLILSLKPENKTEEEKISVNKEQKIERAEPVFNAIEKVKEKSNISLIGFAGGPWTTIFYCLFNDEERKKNISSLINTNENKIDQLVEKFLGWNFKR